MRRAEEARAAEEIHLAGLEELDDHVPLNLSVAEQQEWEVSKALRTISFDHSAQGKESKMGTYSAFYEFNKVVVQFGYLGYFSGAFPAAPLLACIYNIYEIRVEAAHMINYCKRPRSYRVKGVRVWVTALNVIAYTGMIINILMLGLSSFSLRKLLQQTQPLNSFSYFPHLHARGNMDALKSNILLKSDTSSSTETTLEMDQPEWGSLTKVSDRGQDYSGRVQMLWFMIVMEHLLFLMKLNPSLPSALVSTCSSLPPLLYLPVRALAYDETKVLQSFVCARGVCPHTLKDVSSCTE